MSARRIFIILTILCILMIGIVLTFDSGYRVGKDIADRENNARVSGAKGGGQS